MGKYLGPKLKLYKREAADLFLKSKIHKICNQLQTKPHVNSFKDSNRSKKVSDFNKRLREKQKVKRIYGILEKQFYNYYKLSVRSSDNTGNKLLQLLESRLDNVIFRMGIAVTRAQSRQLIVHKNIIVNNQIVNIPSYQVRVNDQITLTSKAKSFIVIQKALSLTKYTPLVKWLEVNYSTLEGTVKKHPSINDIDLDIQTQLIIEFYSK